MHIHWIEPSQQDCWKNQWNFDNVSKCKTTLLVYFQDRVFWPVSKYKTPRQPVCNPVGMYKFSQVQQGFTGETQGKWGLTSEPRCKKTNYMGLYQLGIHTFALCSWDIVCYSVSTVSKCGPRQLACFDPAFSSLLPIVFWLSVGKVVNLLFCTANKKD